MDKKILATFVCYGKHMVVVKLERGTHVMDIEEWKCISAKHHLKQRNKSNKRKTA